MVGPCHSPVACTPLVLTFCVLPSPLANKTPLGPRIKRDGPKVLTPQPLEQPNPACGVCLPAVTVRVDTASFTIGDFFEKVLQGALGCEEPSLDDVRR